MSIMSEARELAFISLKESNVPIHRLRESHLFAILRPGRLRWTSLPDYFTIDIDRKQIT